MVTSTESSSADNSQTAELRETNRQLRLAQQQAERDRERLFSLFEQAPAIIAIQSGPEHIFDLVNPRAQAMLGGRDVLGLAVREALPELATQPFFEMLDQVYRSGQPVFLNSQLVNLNQPDASVRRAIIDIVYQPWRDTDGQIAGVMTFGVEVTEQKLAQDALRKAEEDQRFLASVSELLAASLDYQANLSRVARQLIPRLADTCIFDLVDSAAPLGFTRMVVAHQDPAKESLIQLIDFQYPVDPTSLHPLMQILAHNQDVILVEMTDADLQAQAHNEEHLQLLRYLAPRSVISLPLRVRDRLVGAFSLISEQAGRYQNQAEVALIIEIGRRVSTAIDNALLYQESQTALVRQQELDYLKDQFLSIVSHDLRTPLTSIKGYAQMLDRQFQKYAQTTGWLEDGALETATRSVNVINHQVARMQELIIRLLEFSRVQADQLELNYTRQADLVAFVEQVAAQHNIGSTQARVNFESATSSMLVDFDEARLEQVLDNLITNALKYSPPATTVTVGLNSPAEGQAVVWVRDQGYGIAPEQQKRLFEQFYRARNTQTRQVEGLGLGLYISAQVVAQHGGHIWVESQPNLGSTFFFSLPLIAPDRPD